MVKRNFYQNRRLTKKARPDYKTPLVFNASEGNFDLSKLKPSRSVLKKVIGLIFISAIIYFFFFSSTFALKDIIVEGNHYVSSDRITSVVPLGTNIFRLREADVAKGILVKIPEIKQARIYRGIPNAIKIVVLERDGRLVWETSAGKYLVSSQGEVAKKIGPEEEEKYKDLLRITDKANLPVKIGAALISPSFVTFVTNLHSQFYEATNIKPTNFEIEETTFDVILHTEAGFYVKFNSTRSSKKQLDNLKKILVEKRDDIHEYVDLRIDGWAYYK